MNELENEFITQLKVDIQGSGNIHIEEIYNDICFNNRQKHELLKKLDIERKEQEEYNLNQQMHISEIEQVELQNDQLSQEQERIIYTVLLKRKHINNQQDQLRMLNIFYKDLPIEYRESQQTKQLSYISYSSYKSSYEDYIKLLENKRLDMLEHLEKVKSETLQTKQSYKNCLQKIQVCQSYDQQAQQVLVDQEKNITQLDQINNSLKFKLHEQRKVMIDLELLLKLEKMYITFEEQINDEFQQEDINQIDCCRTVTDFTQTHPFGVQFLVENLIQQYRKYQVQIDSESSQANDLIEEKKELLQELKDLNCMNAKFHIFDENDEEEIQNFSHLQYLISFLAQKKSQNNFKQNLLFKAESFIVKVFGNLFNSLKRFNDIFQAIHQKRMAIDLKSQQIDSKIKNYCANTYVTNQSLSAYQFSSNPLAYTMPELFTLIQNSIILKLYVNEDALNQFLQTGTPFLKLYIKASDYYYNQIKTMMELIQSTTFIPRRQKFSFTDLSPVNINYKSRINIEISQKKISLRTDLESRAQINFKTKTTKRNSFTSTIGSSRRIPQDNNEEHYLESERQKIINPQSSVSNYIKTPSNQQKYCELLSERTNSIDKKSIVQNFKSLIKLRQNKRKFKPNQTTLKSLIGGNQFIKTTFI